MTRRFSSDHLYALRNEIPIDALIEKYLSIPCNRTENRFRFTCPLCAGFKTSVLWEKNLGRCFQCNENLNTIELVMHCMDVEFVESVKRLDKIRDEMTQIKQCVKPDEQIDSFEPDDKDKNISDNLSDRSNIENDTGQPDSGNRNLAERMDELETKIRFLGNQIEKIYHTLIT